MLGKCTYKVVIQRRRRSWVRCQRGRKQSFLRTIYWPWDASSQRFRLLAVPHQMWMARVECTSGRLGEAALRGGEAIIAAGATGVGQAVERFGFRNAERAAAQVEQRVLPRIIGRPADAEQLIIRAGQRAQDVERAATADIEQFAAEQAAAEGGELAPLLVEAGTQTAAEAAAAEAAGGGILEGLAAAGGAAAEGLGTAAAATFPIAEGLGMAAGAATRGVAALAGGAAYGLYQGGRWLLSGNGGDAASS